MNEQFVLEDFEYLSSNFEQSQVDNESEEDIREIQNLTFSDLALAGTDWTVETIIRQIKKGNIQLNPSFQRRNAWSGTVKSRFIESLFLGLPIPQIILAEEKNRKGKYIVIDGKQRLLCLKQFVHPDDGENSLRLSGLEVLSKFNRMTYSDIEQNMNFDDIEAFNNQTIRTVVIKSWRNVEILYLLFLRLNTGSVKLSPQELRQALYPGPFINYVNHESVQSTALKDMLKIKSPDFRMRDVEILIRFFSFYFFADKYTGSMQSFLDFTCDSLNKSFLKKKHEIDTAMEAFTFSVNLTTSIFNEVGAFRKFKNGKYEDRYNRAVIDIMLYFFSQFKDDNAVINNHQKQIVDAYTTLCSDDPAFISSLESTTKSLASVHYRFRKWGETLSGITGKELQIPIGY